tara:strand:- start:419 stop:628 length:210 start_codon:yes stop_codon:yes gene_type:complete
MITFKNELPLDHKISIKRLVDAWARDYLENYLDICKDTTSLSELDYCLEIAEYWLEEQLKIENLEMEIA